MSMRRARVVRRRARCGERRERRELLASVRGQQDNIQLYMGAICAHI